MSEAAVEDGREFVELPDRGDAAFGALLDALAPEGEAAKAGGTDGASGAPAVGAAPSDPAQPEPQAGGDGQPAADAGDAATGSGAGQAGRTAAEGAGQDGDRPDQPAGGGAEQPAADGGAATAPERWTLEPSKVVPKLGELSEKVEESFTKSHQQQAFKAVREEHGKYFEALEKHPRMLVGAKVPSIGKEGEDTLRSSEDAKEWQEAVKMILVQEINARAQTSIEESRAFLETVHASIDLFKNNTDLIPGTKGFNRELADKFATFAKPYEVRVDGKLHGYSIPVQPLIENLRAQMKPVAPSTTVKNSQTSSPPADPPQAGIPSKAASSSEKEDFSTLFGTIGLPHLKI